jgi:hypothetical protein
MNHEDTKSTKETRRRREKIYRSFVSFFVLFRVPSGQYSWLFHMGFAGQGRPGCR